MTNLSSLVDSYGVYSYKDDLIYYKVENFRNWRHRELAVQKDWLLKIYINGLDQEILTERPIFTPDIFGGKGIDSKDEEETDVSSEEDLKPDISPQTQVSGEETEKDLGEDIAVQDVSEDWENEKWDNLLLKMFDTPRTHSYCVIVLYNTAPWWRVFSEREIESIEYDKKGHPTGCHVSWTLELPKSNGVFINFDEDLTFYDRTSDNNDGRALFVPYGVAKGNRLGEYDIEDLWSLAIDIRYINLDITNNSAKSSGFYFLKYGDALKEADSQTIVDTMDIIGSNRAIGAKKGALEDIVAIHPTQASFAIDALLAKLKIFAATSRLPLAFYVGEKETGGVFTEGFTDESKVDKKKKYIFGQFKPYIKDLVRMRWGIEVEDVELYIEETEKESFEFGDEDDGKGNTYSQDNQA